MSGWSLIATYQTATLSQPFDDNVRSYTLLNERLDLLEDLSSEENDTGRSVSDLSVLSTSNVNQSAGRWVNNVKQSK